MIFTKSQKLKSVTKQLLRRFNKRISELNLSSDDLIVVTSKEYIRKLFRKSAIRVYRDEAGFRLKDIVLPVMKEILSLSIAREDFSFTT